MNTLKKQLAFLLVFSILFSLLSGLSVKAALPSTPTLDAIEKKLYANGHPIVIEAGVQDPNKTRIRYDNDKYLIFGSDSGTTSTEVDLSEHEIYGGASTESVASSSITMTGGKVRLLAGGGSNNAATVTGAINIHISGTAQIKTLYGGGANNNATSGDVTIDVSGGRVETLLGAGTQYSSVKSASINITGGVTEDIYGAGTLDSHVTGNVSINITNGTVNILNGGGREGSNVNGNVSIQMENTTVQGSVYGGGYKNSTVKGNLDMNIANSTISGKVHGNGDDNSPVEGTKSAVIDSAKSIDTESFTKLYAKDTDNNWYMKGNVSVEQGKNIVIEAGKTFEVFAGSTLALDGTITNNGTFLLRNANGLSGNGTLEGNGKYQTVSDTLSEDDITVQTEYPYTGEIIRPVHSLNKTVSIFNHDFDIINWKFAATEPAEVRNAGEYTLRYKKDGENMFVNKQFRVLATEQKGSISLDRQDSNNDRKINAGDILSVNLSGLMPQGGTPAYSWKKKSGTKVETVGAEATYTLQKGDEGAEIYCVVTFSGNTTGSLETNKLTSKLPAPKITFPSADSIYYGRKLKDSMLRGGSTEYGRFEWASPDTVPTLQNSGYEVRFIPSAETIAKYEPISETSKTVAIKVLPNVYLPPYIPEVEKQEETKEKKDTKVQFEDVKPQDYFADAVLWAVKNGITQGTSDNRFSPYMTSTRGQIISFLWRMGGSQTTSKKSVFTDIDTEKYYADAIHWAVEKKIAGGFDATTFAPDAVCTRAQAITLLYRYANSPQVKEHHSFKDVNANDYYAKAVSWATANGITNGTDKDTFHPNAECNRAQILTFLYRFASLSEKK